MGENILRLLLVVLVVTVIRQYIVIRRLRYRIEIIRVMVTDNCRNTLIDWSNRITKMVPRIEDVAYMPWQRVTLVNSSKSWHDRETGLRTACDDLQQISKEITEITGKKSMIEEE